MRHARNRLGTTARSIQAEQVHPILPQFDQRSAAGRTNRRRLNIRLRRFALPIPNNAHDFRNDVIRAAYPNLASNAHPFATDIVIVVERRAFNRHAADVYRRQVRQRRKLACSANFPCDFQQLGDGLLRRKFERNRPAREFVCRAKHLARAHIRNLNGRAVNQKVKRFTLFFNLMNSLQRLFNRLRRADKWTDVQPVCLHKIQHILLSLKAPALDIADLIEKSIQMPAGRHLRIEIAKRARRRIARIFQRLSRRFVVFF